MTRERDLPRHPTERAATPPPPPPPLRHSQQPVVKDSRGELWAALGKGELSPHDFNRKGQLRLSASVGVLQPIVNGSADWRAASERLRSGTRYGQQTEAFVPPDPPTPNPDGCDGAALRTLQAEIRSMERAAEAREEAHERALARAAGRERALFKILAGVFAYYSSLE